MREKSQSNFDNVLFSPGNFSISSYRNTNKGPIIHDVSHFGERGGQQKSDILLTHADGWGGNGSNHEVNQ